MAYTDFGLRHVKTILAGQAGYCGDIPRGHATIEHDSKFYVYDMRGIRAPRAFRTWIKESWSRSGTARVSGKYPRYTVDVEY